MSKESLHPGLVWDWPVRVFHWLLAVSFAAAYVTAERESLRHIHIFFGYLAGGLLAFRLAWGLMGTRWARFESFWPSRKKLMVFLRSVLGLNPEHCAGHNPAGAIAIFGMLLLGAASVSSGWMVESGTGADIFEEAHEALSNAWLVLVLVHLAGVTVESILHRENLPLSMLTGFKLVASGEAIPSARFGVALAMLVSAAAFAAWYFSQLP